MRNSNVWNSMLRQLALFAIITLSFACAASGARAQDRPNPAHRITTMVILSDSYPAFARQPAAANALAIRAIVLVRDPTHGDSSVVILNPAHANARTLYEALSVLRRSLNGQMGKRDASYVALGPTPGVREPSGPIASQLDSLLTALHATPSSPAQGRRIPGRMAQVNDVWAFFPESTGVGR
jgi:hypothetical protein